MIEQKLRKDGENYVVTIPAAEVARLGLKEGDVVVLDVQPLDEDADLEADVDAALEESWARNEGIYRALGK